MLRFSVLTLIIFLCMVWIDYNILDYTNRITSPFYMALDLALSMIASGWYIHLWNSSKESY